MLTATLGIFSKEKGIFLEEPKCISSNIVSTGYVPIMLNRWIVSYF